MERPSTLAEDLDAKATAMPLTFEDLFAEDEHQLVEEIQRHARGAHRMALTHDEALVLALRAELGASPGPGGSTRQDNAKARGGGA